MNSDETSRLPVYEYVAAGGVVLAENKVLVLERPGRQEVRLPKGHVEHGEELSDAALREVSEESGYSNLRIITGLGVQQNEFDFDGRHIIRQEYFFLMELVDAAKTAGEAEFRPRWLRLEEAIEQLSFQVEKEWVRRATHYLKEANSISR